MGFCTYRDKSTHFIESLRKTQWRNVYQAGNKAWHAVSFICHWTVHKIVGYRDSLVKILPSPEMFRLRDLCLLPSLHLSAKHNHQGGGWRGEGRPQYSLCDGGWLWYCGIGLGVGKGAGPVNLPFKPSCWEIYFINKRRHHYETCPGIHEGDV